VNSPVTSYVSLKTDVNVGYLQEEISEKNLYKNKLLVDILKATAKKSRTPVDGSKELDPGSVSKCHGSKTEQVTYLSRLMLMYTQ
jgi:hypothetical protein